MKCKLCDGSGWVVTEKSGVSGVEPCSCRKEKIAQSSRESRRPNEEEISKVVNVMRAARIPFFPDDPEGIQVVSEAVGLVAETVDELAALQIGFLTTVKRWEGPGMLRQVISDQMLIQAEKRRAEIEAAETERKMLIWRAEAVRLLNGRVDPVAVTESVSALVLGPKDLKPLPVSELRHAREIEDELLHLDRRDRPEPKTEGMEERIKDTNLFAIKDKAPERTAEEHAALVAELEAELAQEMRTK